MTVIVSRGPMTRDTLIIPLAPVYIKKQEETYSGTPIQ
jgi:hypothetical protein